MQLDPDVMAAEAWREKVRHLLGQSELNLQSLPKLQIDPPDACNASVCVSNLQIEPGLRSAAVNFQNTTINFIRKRLEPLACHVKIKAGIGRWCEYCLRLFIIGTLREAVLTGL